MPATAGLRKSGGGAPVNDVPAAEVGYGLQKLTQKDQGRTRGLTEARIERGGHADGATAMSGGGAGAELEEVALQECSGPSDPRGRSMQPYEGVMVVRGNSGVAGGEKSGGGSLTGGGAVRRSAAVLDSGLRWRAWCDVEASGRSLKAGPRITALWRRKVIAGDLGGA